MLRIQWITGLAGLVLVAGLAFTTTAQERRKQHPLVELLKQQQAIHVGESWGPWIGQCFTWEDLKRFKEADVLGQIVAELRDDAKFAEIVSEVRQMAPSARSELLRQAGNTCKPTWRQLGRTSPAGQTDAGQQAERLIAAAVTGLVRQMLPGTPGRN